MIFNNLFKNDHHNGNIALEKVYIDSSNISVIANKFFSIDTETTGLSQTDDKIIEIGVCYFENKILKSSFGSLIKSVDEVPSSATKVNHITTEMLLDAPNETDVYHDFIDFIGGAINGDTIFVAHNATFDFGFIKNALERNGYSGNLKYIDTLALARKILPFLDNHKQDTILEFYSLHNNNAHRAKDDAELCGQMFIKLSEDNIDKLDSSSLSNSSNNYFSHNNIKEGYNCFGVKIENIIPNEEEKEICAIVKNVLFENNKCLNDIYFYRNSNGIVEVSNGYTRIFRFRILKNKKYIIVDRNYVLQGYQLEETSSADNYENSVRMIFDNPHTIRDMTKCIIENYDLSVEQNKMYEKFIFRNNCGFCKLDDCDCEELENISYKKYEERIQLSKEKEIAAQLLAEEKLKKKEEQEKKKKELEIAKDERIKKAKDYAEKFGFADSDVELTHGKKPICKMNDEGTIVKTYSSLSEAIKDTGINSKSIRDCTTGKQKHAGGYVWRYLEQLEK